MDLGNCDYSRNALKTMASKVLLLIFYILMVCNTTYAQLTAPVPKPTAPKLAPSAPVLEHSPGFQNMIASESIIHYVSYIWNSGRNLEF
jgi:hypothetical protein